MVLDLLNMFKRSRQEKDMLSLEVLVLGKVLSHGEYAAPGVAKVVAFRRQMDCQKVLFVIKVSVIVNCLSPFMPNAASTTTRRQGAILAHHHRCRRR